MGQLNTKISEFYNWIDTQKKLLFENSKNYELDNIQSADVDRHEELQGPEGSEGHEDKNLGGGIDPMVSLNIVQKSLNRNAPVFTYAMIMNEVIAIASAPNYDE